MSVASTSLALSASAALEKLQASKKNPTNRFE
jgi:hypothetical protein